MMPRNVFAVRNSKCLLLFSMLSDGIPRVGFKLTASCVIAITMHFLQTDFCSRPSKCVIRDDRRWSKPVGSTRHTGREIALISRAKVSAGFVRACSIQIYAPQPSSSSSSSSLLVHRNLLNPNAFTFHPINDIHDIGERQCLFDIIFYFDI